MQTEAMSFRKSNNNEDVDLAVSGLSTFVTKPNGASKNNIEMSSENYVSCHLDSPGVKNKSPKGNSQGFDDVVDLPVNVEPINRNPRSSSPDELLSMLKNPSSMMKMSSMRTSPINMNFALPNVPLSNDSQIISSPTGHLLEAPLLKNHKDDNSSVKSNLSLPPGTSPDGISDAEFWNSLHLNSGASVKSSHSAPNIHSGDGDALNCLKDHLSCKTPTLNNASNLTNKSNNRPHQKALRASLGSLANSHQNLTSKTPVNQLRSPYSMSRNIAEDYIRTVNMAAVKIQRWYRRQIAYRQESDIAFRRLLEEKKAQRLAMAAKEKKLQEKKARKKKKSSVRKVISGKTEVSNQNSSKSLEWPEVALKIEPDSGLSTGSKASKSGCSSRVSKKPVCLTYEDVHPKKQSCMQPKVRELTEPAVCGSSVSSLSRDVDEFLEEICDQLKKHNLLDDIQAGESPAHTSSRTTFGDLLETLQRLENDKELAVRSDASQPETGFWEHYSDHQCDRSDIANMVNNKPQMCKRDLWNGLLPEDKLRNVLSFLDEVDRVDTIVLEEARYVEENVTSQSKSNELFDPLGRATQTASQVTSTIMKQRLEIEEKNKIINSFKRVLIEQRESNSKQAKEAEEEMKNKLKQQKDEYETAIKKHLAFIDQLMKEKQILTDKCHQLVKQLKTSDERHKVDLQKARDKLLASEKLEKEKWIKDKTKQIKELTIKGLEPEVRRIINKHKEEIQRLKSQYSQEIAEAEKRAVEGYANQLQSVKLQLKQERKAACQREQELAKERYAHHSSSEDMTYRQQFERLFSQMMSEKEGLKQQLCLQDKQIETLKQELRDAKVQVADTVQLQVNQVNEQHKIEMSTLAAKLNFEKELWENELKKNQELLYQSREKQLKEDMKKNWDQEIEALINKLNDEVVTTRKEYQRITDSRMKLVKSQYEMVIKELEKSQQNTLQMLNESQQKYETSEEEKNQLKIALKEQREEINNLKKELTLEQEEKRKIIEILRQESPQANSSPNKEKRLYEEILELRARHAAELERSRKELFELQRVKDAEMEEVLLRIKSTVSKKENTITHLKHLYQVANQKVEHLQKLLEEQRCQLLIK